MDRSTHRTTGRLFPALMITSVIGLYLLPLAGLPQEKNPNELVRLELAVAMSQWSTVELDRPARVYGLSEDVARREGRILADKAPGLSFAAVPVVWMARLVLPSVPGNDLPSFWPLRHFATAILVATTSVALFLILAASIPALDRKKWVPFAVLGALTTPLWTYGTVFFGHAPAAVMITAAWVLLLTPLSNTGRSDPRREFLGGLAAGFAITTEYPVFLLVVVIFTTLVARRSSAKTVITAAAGLAVGLLPLIVYHHVAFGAPWLTGYAFKADSGFAEIHTTGVAGIALPTIESLWGVLIGPARGLFFFSPVLLLTPVGFWLIHRRYGFRESAPLVAASLVYIVFAAGFVDWTAGWCAAARHLIPLVPLLWIPAAVAMAELAQHRLSLTVVAILTAFSATRGFLTLVVTPFFPPEFSRPLSQLVLPSLADGAWAPNGLTSATGIPPLIVWTAAAGLAVGLLVWSLSRLAGGSATFLAAILGAAVVVQIGWLAWRSTPVDPELEMFRAQILARQGHSEAAADIVGGLASHPE